MFDPLELRGVYANAAALKLWQAETLDELLARDFSNLSPAVRARTQRLFKETEGGTELTERWTFYPNGMPITVQATISRYHLDEKISVLLFEASRLDVEPEERRSVEALRHASTKISLLDSDQHTVFLNPAAFSAYEASGDIFEARFVEPTRGRALFEKALDGAPAAEVCRTVTSAGERWHHVDARRVLDPVTGGVGVLVNELDVTERMDAEQAKAAAEQKAAMAEARQRFLTDMSHELRTPLNAVIGFSDLLTRNELTPDQSSYARRIYLAGGQLLEVVNEMISLSELTGWSGERRETAAPIAEPLREMTEDTSESLISESADRCVKILYADDNPSNRALVEAVLGSQGIYCVTAEDGDLGVDLARNGDWDLILMDIQMPRLDGIRSTLAIRALPGPISSVPILALTANTLPEQIADYLEAGMNDCIPKPIQVAPLLDRIFSWIDRTLPGETIHLRHARLQY